MVSLKNSSNVEIKIFKKIEILIEELSRFKVLCEHVIFFHF